ncbi:cellulose-binding GDSL lipase acylhydrolase [Podospora conica]|nr:cellulose-binding GDSL lipase acylhydrolase [Schizothecium conicum]
MKTTLFVPLLATLALSAPTADSKPKYLITFGDSYTQTGFSPTGAAPSPSNPLGNPALPGWTASGGLNWVGFLVSQLNATSVLSYNFADGGATTDAALVKPWKEEVRSFGDQVKQYKEVEKGGRWAGGEVVVGVWMGVNDVGNAWWKPEGEYEELLEGVGEGLFGEGGLGAVVKGGGVKGVVVLGVPPIHKTPSVLTQTPDVQTAEAAAIAKYNAALVARLEAFRAAHPAVEAVYVDTAPAFNEALGNPKKYGSPDATCYNGDGVSCLWFNDYHPGVAINRLVAESVASAWKGKGWFR